MVWGAQFTKAPEYKQPTKGNGAVYRETTSLTTVKEQDRVF